MGPGHGSLAVVFPVPPSDSLVSLLSGFDSVAVGAIIVNPSAAWLLDCPHALLQYHFALSLSGLLLLWGGALYDRT